MSTDWREKEREFLTSLKADTGRDLGEWMRVIAAQNLPHRNDIIDWLRQQGFIFARASWLERILHNQGRPIYLDPAELKPATSEAEAVADIEIAELQRVAAGGSRMVFVAAPSSGTAVQSPQPRTPSRTVPPPRIAVTTPEPLTAREDEYAGASGNGEAPSAAVAPPATEAENRLAGSPQKPAVDEPLLSGGVETSTACEPAGRGESATANLSAATPATPSQPQSAEASTPLATPASASTALDEVLAKAKAYRPLAVHLKRMIETAIPDLQIVPGPGHLLLLRDGKAFGLLAISGKDIRLVLRLNSGVACAPFGKIKLPVTLSRVAQGMTHMAVLTDARELNEALINLVCEAAGR